MTLYLKKKDPEIVLIMLYTDVNLETVTINSKVCFNKHLEMTPKEPPDRISE